VDRAAEISVVVCTRNRSRSLVETLGAALALAARAPWELVVVDNASTDDTLEVARAVERRHPERVRVAVEPVLGLSAARNLGVRLARGAIVAFLDDDALPAPGWLAAYAEALAEPDVLSAGGPVEPVYRGELPGWLGERFLTYLSVWDRGPEPCDLRYIELPRGANVAYRREAFVRVGEFDRRLGRSGRSLRSCEEIELGLRIERCGFRTRYAPGARVRHAVEAARLTPAWMIRRFAAQGFSEAIIDWKHFGAPGLRDGTRRRREAVARARREGEPGSLWLRCQRVDARAYRRGALYALLAVGRWHPPRPTEPCA
jgi:glycosyltransferase involved in cell wall biosynthesis